MIVNADVNGLELGNYYCDSATGFRGVAVGYWVKLGGNVQVSLARIGQDGKPVEIWFDADRLGPVTAESHGAHV